MPDNNVIPLGGITRLDLPIEQVFDQVRDAIGSDGRVLVLGWDEDGDLCFKSSFADGGEVLWLMEKAKLALLNIEVP